MNSTIRNVSAVLATGCLLMAFSAHAGDASAGKAKSENCAQCHGEDGKEDPAIAGMEEAKFIQAMKDYQAGARKHKKMEKAASGLTDANIADLAAYYASLK
ncbi:MAG: c-type cytochrome [Thiobacillaceae bacterium]|jgi:cytochrome c553|nr:c-type cytochrome [Thiobacillaceae bacterium]